MANPAEIRKKIEARKVAKQAAQKAKFAKMRHVAENEPMGVEKDLTQLADACAAQAEAFENLKENLDLILAPKEASLKIRVAAARNYAKSFKRIAEEAPEQLAEALSEAYHSLDEQAGALEQLAGTLGIDLGATPTEEAFAQEGIQELNEADEEGVPVGDVPEPGMEDGEEKEAAGDGSAGFVTDRGADGNPKKPEEVNVPRVAAGGGEAGFVTDRDNKGKPERPAKVEIPQAQGKSEALGNKGGSTKGEPAAKFVKDIPQAQGKAEVGAGKSSAQNKPMKQIVPSGTPTGLPAESFVKDIPQSQGSSELNKSARTAPARRTAARGSL
jgi:hypothetical protein